MRAIVIKQPGGPEVLALEERPDPVPTADQVLIEVKAFGLNHAEAYFRSGEQRVIARLLDSGPQVLATGGGAYMNAETRAAVAQKGISVWLKADFEVLMKRVKRRATADRPMLQGDPAQRIRELMEQRYPVYGEANVTVMSRDVAHEAIVNEIIAGLSEHLAPVAGAAP